METLQRTANRGSISTGGYEIDNSLKFEADNSEQLSRDVSSAGSRTTATISMWIKRTEITNAQYLFTYGNTDNDDGRTFARFQADDTLRIAGGSTVWRNTSRVFRDTSAWYHIVIAFDTTQSTANNRIKLYINGVQETSFSTTNNPSEDGTLGLNFQKQAIGYNSVDGGSYFCGYMTEIVHQDGTASAPTEFGETDSDTGIWKPIDVSSVASGTNGFYLDFEDGSNMGNDASGGTDFTETNIAAADQAQDSPTNSFCTMNVLDRTDGNIKNQEGATKITTDGGSSWCNMIATMGITKGKWYWEAQRASSDGNNVFAGVADSQDFYIPYNSAAKYYLGNVANTTAVGWYFDNGQVYNGDATFAAPSANDKVMIALDFDNQAIYFGVNGTWGNSSDPESGASKTGASVYAFNNADWDNFCMPAFTVYQGQSVKVNFGGYTCMSIASGNTDENGYGTFEYTPPSGYYALCTKNLEEFG